ncbi:hypothetical protein [Streptomyces sp. SID3343]|uniref:hypothetical protein n=1 Tax=Streptomyces sp. SID3343 TaxID=2690260 RepID=UPI00136A399F|nr:hypothetical protein [Streptomyces sp. SID3343]MYV98789.1 hypothetical protein [Streptomyces sp. SID3343]
MSIQDPTDRALLTARALVLADLRVHGVESPEVVTLVEHALVERKWWVEQWPEGAAYVPGLIAQDVQEALAEQGTVWPPCPLHDDHPLYIEPELGEDPDWVCEKDAVAVAELGGLAGGRPESEQAAEEDA